MSRRKAFLAVLAVLVALAGNLVAGGFLLTIARNGTGWSRGGPVTGPSIRPSTEPGGEPDRVFRYVALGDSFTAAPGVPDPDGDDGCRRSTNNYPHLVARALPRTKLVDRSCSNANTAHLTTSQLPGVKPQFDGLTADTDLVTISIGANDFEFYGTLLLRCPELRAADPTGAPCSGVTGPASASNLTAAIEQIGGRLKTAIKEIEVRSPDARILLVGYPVIAPATGTCPDRLPLADGDYAYVNRLHRRLLTAMSRAATRAGATYIDVYAAGRGHDICSDDPWVNDWSTDPGRALFYHPFAEEQAAVARLVLAELD